MQKSDKKGKKVLFISHCATKSGAPILLLNLLRWIKTHTDLPFLILLKNGGELEDEFSKLGTVLYYNDGVRRRKTLYSRLKDYAILRLFGVSRQCVALKRGLRKHDIGLIYCNTVANGEVLEQLAFLKCPVITHVHELEYAIRYGASIENFEKVKLYTHLYITPSELVKNNLCENHAIAAENTVIIPEFIPIADYRIENQEHIRNTVREQLALSVQTKIICGAGNACWRKGADLFVQLAYAVRARTKETPLHFIWVGDVQSEEYLYQLRHDIQKAGLQGYIRFMGIQKNYLEHIAACDVFVIPSREEPFSILCLEAALWKRPIVYFHHTIGASEIIDDGRELAVSYLDIDSMAEKILLLLKDENLSRNAGLRAHKKAREHCDIERLAPQIVSLIEERCAP